MPQVRLTQETCLKHFHHLSALMPANSAAWLTEALRNHQERFGAGVLPSNVNTLIIVTEAAWTRILAGEYVCCNPMPQQLPAQLEITISAGDIARLITTTKTGADYTVTADLRGNAVQDVHFTCRLNADTQDYDIIHFHA